MKKIYCRTVQGVIKVANYFLGFRIPEYIEGAGCIKELPEIIKEKGIRRVLFVTDKVIMDLGLPNGFVDAMKEAGMDMTIFCDIERNPTDENIEAGFKLF